MENETTLKDQIIGAIDGKLESFKGDIIVAIDERLNSFKGKIIGEMDKRFKGVDKRFKSVDKRFESLEKKVDDGFQAQGVLLEDMQDDIDTLVDGQEMLHERIDRFQGTVSSIKTKVEQLDTRLTSVEIV